MSIRKVINCGIVLVITASVALESNIASGDKAPAVKQRSRKGVELLMVDRFEEKLGLNWKPIRHDPTHVSLMKNPGSLTITTQRGSIHGDEKNDPAGDGLQAKNLYVIANPLATDTDFTITLAVKKFQPQTYYHQVALLCYDDDDNYLKWGYEHNWREPNTQNFVLVRESAQQPDHDLLLEKSGLNRFWLRVVKRGNKYQCAWSIDGRKFNVVGERPFGNGAPKYLGFVAKNGGNPDAAEIDVCIDSFEIRSKPDVMTDKEQTIPDVTGTVLRVSESGNLVEISVGSDDGVRVGMKLDVFIPGQYRGKVEVLKVMPDKSAAQVLPDYSKDKILPNDQVATRLQ